MGYVKQFTQKENIHTLWEVVSDEDIFKILPNEAKNQTYQLFLNNINGFYNSEQLKTRTLVDMNKKYILLILNHIKKTFLSQPNKIKIHNEPVKELITYEEIHNDRKTQFEKDFHKRQEEFEDFMTVKPPPIPEFADNNRDTPIKEMDKILKEMQTRRNYDIEQINMNYHNTKDNLDNWLTPQETSLKTEKLTSSQSSQPYSRFKFLNTIDPEVSETAKDKKNVSFSNIQEIQTFNIGDGHGYTDGDDDGDDNGDDDDTSIFSKLKKIPNKAKNEYDNANIKLEIDEFETDRYVTNEDKITKLERKLEDEVRNIHSKIDKILELLTNHNKEGFHNVQKER